jgi:hypothetical protein
MKSRILGKIPLDYNQLSNEVERIIKFPYIKDSYTEFVFGHLHMSVLWNSSGKSTNNVFNYDSKNSIPTELGKQLPYINSVIEKCFYLDKILMVRANLLYNCLLVPHRDYTEIKDGYSKLVRLHLPIHTHPTCLNSEESEVFHMKEGEIWRLNVGGVHAAYCPTDFPRISIMIDFKCENENFESIFKDTSILNSDFAPTLKKREDIDAKFMDSIIQLKHFISRDNYEDVVQLLSKVHFYKRVSIRDFYDWLILITKESGDQLLMDKTEKLRNFFTVHRELNERFSYQIN